MRTLKTWIVLVGCFALLLAGAELAVAQTSDEDNFVSFRVTTSWGRFSNPMWHIGTTSQFTTFPLVWPPLVWTDSQGNIVPWLAERYEVNEDATKYTFHLPKDAKWTDGHPLTAEDYKFAFELGFSQRAVEEGVRVYQFMAGDEILGAEEYHRGEADEIEGIRVIDPHTLVIETKEPALNFLIAYTTHPVGGPLPKHILGNLTWDELLRHPYLDNPDVTAGPYRFVEFVRENRIVLEAREDDGWPHKQPSVKTLYALPLSGFDTYEARLEAGELDIGEIRTSEIERMSKIPHLDIRPSPSVGFQMIGINVARVTDKRVRQAFMYALQRDVLKQIRQGDAGEVIHSPIFAPEWAVSPNLNPYDYNPDKARQLLEEANWDYDRELVWITTSDETALLMAEFVQESLRLIGVKVKIEIGTSQNVIARWHEGDYDFYPLGGGVPGLDPSLAVGYVISEPLPNYYNYDNPYYNELALRGVQTSSIEERAKIYQELSEILNEDLPLLPLYQQANNYAVNKKVRGFVHPLSPYQLLTNDVLDWSVEH